MPALDGNRNGQAAGTSFKGLLCPSWTLRFFSQVALQGKKEEKHLQIPWKMNVMRFKASQLQK